MPVYSSAVRARLFTQFATLERSGITLLQALPILRKQSPPALHKALDEMTTAVERGVSLAEAGQLSGTLLPREVRLIRAAEDAGGLGQALSHLRDHYLTATDSARRLRTKLTYPLVLLTLALLLLPLPTLVRGDISTGGYLARSLVPLTLLYLCYRLMLGAYQRLNNGRPGGVGSGLLTAIPLLRQQLCYDALNGLALLLSAGIAPLQALETAQQCAGDRHLKRQFGSALRALKQGATLSEALQAAELLDADNEVGLLHSGEAAGRFDESFAFYLRRYGERLDQRQQFLAEWLPRLAYFALVGFIAWSLVR